MKLVINADDLGLTLAANEGIRAAYKEGFLTSASLMANMPAFRNAVDEVLPDCAGLGVGVHLNIIDGQSGRNNITGQDLLCDATGRYRLGYRQLMRVNGKLLETIEADFRQQIESILEVGVRPTHLDSHRHVHMIPAIFEAVCKLAAEYDVAYVRLAGETFYTGDAGSPHCRLWYASNLVKFLLLRRYAHRNRKILRRYGLQSSDHFIGVLYTGYMSADTVLRGLAALAPRRPVLVEVLLHPSNLIASREEVYEVPYLRDYTLNPARTEERRTLQNQAVYETVLQQGWTLTHYGEVNAPAQKYFPRAKEVKRLKTFVIMDEIALYHPEYLQRIIRECEALAVCGAGVVELPNGGPFRKYLLKNLRQFRPTEILKLALKTYFMGWAGHLPRWMRGQHEGSVKAVLRQNQIPYRTIARVNTDEFLDYVRSFEPDIILSSNSLIFKEELLALPKVACINRHSALLPSYGGLLPVFRAVQFGEAHTGASVHYMVPAIDEGGVLSRKWVPIFPTDTLDKLYRLCFIVSLEATKDAARKLAEQPDAAPLSNDGLPQSYYRFPAPEDWQEFRTRGIPFI